MLASTVSVGIYVYNDFIVFIVSLCFNWVPNFPSNFSYNTNIISEASKIYTFLGEKSIYITIITLSFFIKLQRPYLHRHLLWWNQYWMGSMSVFLHMDRQVQGRLSQWKEHLTIEVLTTEHWKSCFEFQKRETLLWNISCLLACWKFTTRK